MHCLPRKSDCRDDGRRVVGYLATPQWRLERWLRRILPNLKANVAGFEEDPATFDFEDVAASVRYRILPHSTFLSPCFVTGFVRCRKLAKDTLLLRVYGQIPEQQTDELDSFIFLGMLRDPPGVFIDDSKTTSLLKRPASWKL